MAKKKTNYVIFKKEGKDYPFPGEFWQEFESLRAAKREFKDFNPKHFHLIKAVYEVMPNAKLTG